jgi:hypothetical protein
MWNDGSCRCSEASTGLEETQPSDKSSPKAVQKSIGCAIKLDPELDPRISNRLAQFRMQQNHEKPYLGNIFTPNWSGLSDLRCSFLYLKAD